ncbi:hypothetical protein [Brevifollis gellanilyticus]|uniref:hypothetical protein n=1 Tax=Brevifollis gellanilyticus TaxID=748831 RepID=UPI001478996F|nr:hypothetical protein [Brevifollis gellanilyticus]
MTNVEASTGHLKALLAARLNARARWPVSSSALWLSNLEMSEFVSFDGLPIALKRLFLPIAFVALAFPRIRFGMLLLILCE